MKIGILGSGTVARTLAAAWAAKEHQIYIGARDSQKPELIALKQQYPLIQIGTLTEAAGFADVVLLAINPWTEIEPTLKPLANILQGKVLIDVSNNITFDGKPALAFTDKSMGEFIQEIIPEAYVVKTLNITPAVMMVQPHQSGITPAIGWVSGNNTDAKETVSKLIKDLGWDEVMDLGKLHNARLQENIGLIFSVIVTGMQA